MKSLLKALLKEACSNLFCKAKSYLSVALLLAERELRVTQGYIILFFALLARGAKQSSIYSLSLSLILRSHLFESFFAKQKATFR